MLKVMIVDDEKIAREGLKDLVDWASLDMEIAAVAVNGREALDYLQEHPVDILLTDIKMPQMDGLELLHELSHQESMPTCIVFSGFHEFQYAQKAIQYGVVSYLLKPIRMDELMEALRKAAQRHVQEIPHVTDADEVERFHHQARPEAGRITDEMGKAICAGDEEDVRALLEALYALFEEGAYSVEVRRRYCFKCIYELTRAVERFSGETLFLESTERIMGLMAAAQNPQELHRTLVQCVDDLCEQIHTVRRNGRRRIISDALFIIQEQYAQPTMSMGWLAQKLDLSPNYLSSLFSKEMGQTFSEYLEAYRLERAKQLLKNTQMKVYEIASAVGYTDPKYFTKVFKQQEGKTPQEYRHEVEKG